jgi:dCTP deaminase
VARAFEQQWPEVASLLRDAGLAPYHYRRHGRLPWRVAAHVPGLLAEVRAHGYVRGHGERHRLASQIPVTEDIAWLLGMYVAEGHRRDLQVTISNTDQARLDRLQATFAGLGLPVSRSLGAVTCCSRLLSRLFDWMEMGGHAPTKRVPPIVFGWPTPLIRSFLDGLVDGDGSTAGGRTSVWTTSPSLVTDLLLLFARLGQRAGCSCKSTDRLPLWQVYAPDREHKLLTSVPLPDELLRGLRDESGLSQVDAAAAAGYSHPTDLNNIERRRGRDAVRFETLRRLREAYRSRGVDTRLLDRLVDGHLAWDRVLAVTDTGRAERSSDIEVRPGGRKVENFLAGAGGVFVSNTAGFIDAGFDGHITLELSNVANLPITLYPGMKIGQISFLRMTTPADVPYGSGNLKSKYQGQRGPTPSRYWENFEAD